MLYEAVGHTQRLKDASSQDLFKFPIVEYLDEMRQHGIVSIRILKVESGSVDNRTPANPATAAAGPERVGFVVFALLPSNVDSPLR